MIIQANVGVPIQGQIDNYNKFLMMNLELAGACGVPSTVKVSSFGTPNVEISTMMLFNDWEEHGAKVEEMRSHAKWKEIMEFGGQTAAFGETVDSYMSQLVRGFEGEAKFSEGPILATAWRPEPGKLADMLALFHESKEVHEAGGCMVRVFQILGGRYAGCYAYNMSFEDNIAYGKCMAAIQEGHAKIVQKAEANPSSHLVAQFKMDNPVLVG
ncbi:hypothetical protein N9Y79_05350 [Alphaproteobacteria bacterium]|nr:hypothetical protein [Alphaproteobacteria bacterium]MDB2641940.1 hypothetical protein [Alphaproteobacteria bacterium]